MSIKRTARGRRHVAYRRGRAAGGPLGWQHGFWQGRSQALMQLEQAPVVRRPMHVLFVTSGKGYPYSPIDEGIYATLLQLADRVTMISPAENVVGAAKQDRPDLVVVLDGMNMAAEKVQELRSQGLRTAVWFTDDPYYTDITLGIAKQYDVVFTLERSCVPFYEQAGCKRVIYLPLGVHPGYYRPNNPRLQLRGDVCFIGTAYWNRVSVFQELLPRIASRRLHLSGLWWDRLPDYPAWQDRIELGKWMTPQETAEYYNANRIVINVHRAHDDETYNQNSAGIAAVSPNPRTFEIAACGTLQIVDEREDIAMFFVPGEEIVTYRTPEELAEKIHYYLDHEEERQLIALRALRRTMREHTYGTRLSQLIDLAMAPL